MSPAHASLDAATVERKARLAKLASLKRKQPESDGQSDQREEGVSDPSAAAAARRKPEVYLSGRNYDSESRGPKLGFTNAPSAGQITLEEQAATVEADTAEQARKDEETADKGIDLFKLQPKKPNWDLKRDLDEKMKILNARTQNAIARLVRERIENAKKDAQSRPQDAVEIGEREGEEVGIEGNTLVESVHLREREEEQDERREQEVEEDGAE